MKNARVLLTALSLVSITAAFGSACSSSENPNTPPSGGRDAGSSEGGSADSGKISCGDGVVSGKEACDTKIAAGTAGACPTAATCDDQNPCTVDEIIAPGTCNDSCDTSKQAAASLGDKDQCCPPGATATTDSDCNPNCGNGKVDTGEACDTKITTGAGVCTSTCPDDADPCTTATLVTADPCNPKCTTTIITAPKDGDQCCPPGANAANDSDCSATCGNGTVETGEDCDETSATCTSCKFVPTAFRFTTLTVAEPPLSVDCGNITPAVNLFISNGFTGDDTGSNADGGGPDGRMDLSFVLLARPLSQTGTNRVGEFLADADCAAPYPPTTCGPDPTVTAQVAQVDNQSTGACLTPDTTRFGVPDAAIQVPNAPTSGTDGCYVSKGRRLDLAISGIPFTFETGRISAEWVGTPATGMANGVIEAFMSLAQAKAITLPQSTPLVGGLPLSALLRGSGDNTCAAADDSRLGPDGTTKGYWFYFNFAAEKVAWTGN